MRNELQKIVNDFVDQLHDLWKRQAIAMFGGQQPLSSDGRRKGEKRTAADLDQLADRFVMFIANNPGLRIEQINAKMGTRTRELALPIRKLLAEKRIKTKGQKRSTTYYLK